MLIDLLTFLLALALLIGASEAVVRGAIGITRHLRIRSFFVSLTIVGFGTSMPELSSGIAATLDGHNDINIGNIIGSNICNIALILGLAAAVCPLPVMSRLVRFELVLVVITALVPLGAMPLGGRFARWEGLVLLGALGLYLWRGYLRSLRDDPVLAGAAAAELEHELKVDRPGWRSSLWLAIALVIGAAIGFIAGSELLVRASVKLATDMGVSELAIGLTVVAIFTSMPELLIALAASLRRRPDIVVGSVLGSNIFNILGILGITSVIRPQHLQPEVLRFDTPVMVGFSMACLPIMLSGGRITRREGLMLVAAYIAYLLLLFTMAPRWYVLEPA